jgi:hypothetical protein
MISVFVVEHLPELQNYALDWEKPGEQCRFICYIFVICFFYSFTSYHNRRHCDMRRLLHPHSGNIVHPMVSKLKTCIGSMFKVMKMVLRSQQTNYLLKSYYDSTVKRSPVHQSDSSPHSRTQDFVVV